MHFSLDLKTNIKIYIEPAPGEHRAVLQQLF